MSKWTDHEIAEAVRLHRAGCNTVQISMALPGRGPSAVRHLLVRVARSQNRTVRQESHVVYRSWNFVVPYTVLTDRDRRVNLPDTLESFFGDPKPGSGQSALEQMRR